MSCCGSGVTGLCGGCGCNPCSCIYQVINETNPVSGVTNVTCVNLSGICVVDAFQAGTIYFRGVASNSALLTVSLDATNHVVLLDLDVNGIAAALPQATTTQRGVGETATDAEALAKFSTTVFVTPSNFAAMAASTTFAGFTAYATNAQAITGTSAALALTPANLTAVFATNPLQRIFADSVARAAATPLFIGQWGYQSDTGQQYVGYGGAPGFWRAIITDGVQNDIQGFQISTGTLSMLSTLQMSNGSVLDFSSGQIAVNGGVQTDSLIGTDNTGTGTAYQLINFLSAFQVRTGYTPFTNPATIRTCNTGTVTLQQLAQLVGTLIEDLKAFLTPAT